MWITALELVLSDSGAAFFEEDVVSSSKSSNANGKSKKTPGRRLTVMSAPAAAARRQSAAVSKVQSTSSVKLDIREQHKDGSKVASQVVGITANQASESAAPQGAVFDGSMSLEQMMRAGVQFWLHSKNSTKKKVMIFYEKGWMWYYPVNSKREKLPGCGIQLEILTDVFLGKVTDVCKQLKDVDGSLLVSLLDESGGQLDLEALSASELDRWLQGLSLVVEQEGQEVVDDSKQTVSTTVSANSKPEIVTAANERQDSTNKNMQQQNQPVSESITGANKEALVVTASEINNNPITPNDNNSNERNDLSTKTTSSAPDDPRAFMNVGAVYTMLRGKGAGLNSASMRMASR